MLGGAPVTFVKLKAFGPLPGVVTVQVPDVVPPTVTVAVVATPPVTEEVWRMAIVSPATNPASVVPPHTPLRAMSVQFTQVALSEPMKPVRVTLLLVMVLLRATPV